MRVTRPAGLMLLALLAFASGCHADGEAVGPPPVAWVGADTLDTERLAHLLVLAQPFPLDTGAVIDLVRHWQAAAALARDPDGRARALHAGIRVSADDAAIDALRSARFGDPAAEAGATAHGVHTRGELRLIAHVLRRADRAARPEERAIQRRAAESILRDLRAGAGWERANRRNEDDAARANAGIIGLIARAELPDPLDGAAFALAPGEYSEVLESAAGFHILHRPRFEDVRAEFTRHLAERAAAEQERTIGAEVATRRNASLVPIAALRVRELATDPWAALAATDPIGTFEGGTLMGGTLAAELAALPWEARRALREAPAPEREAFAGRALVRATLRAEAADSDVAPDTVHLRARISARLDSLARHLPPGVADPRLAVDRYMGRIAARHVALVPPPPAAWRALLDGTDTGLRAAHVGTAIDRARRLLEAGGYAAVNP